MNTKTLFLSLPVFALLALTSPAHAAGASTSGTTSASTKLSSSDENFLAAMSDEDFANTTGAPSGSGLVVGPNGMFVDPSQILPTAENAETTKKAATKYVYKGYSATSIRRLIQDDRIDDDYVQGLMVEHPQ